MRYVLDHHGHCPDAQLDGGPVPGRKAVGGPQPLTYRQWDARTNQLARALAGLGVRPGDRVAFLLAGGEPMASLHLAAQKLGAASVPLSIRFGPAELAYCIRDAEPMPGDRR